jgi:hypothetical protein
MIVCAGAGEVAEVTAPAAVKRVLDDPLVGDGAAWLPHPIKPQHASPTTAIQALRTAPRLRVQHPGARARPPAELA